jgi:thymidine kinase
MSASQLHTGYLEIIVGSMFSGKSSKLIEIYNQYKFCKICVAVINHSSDNRYDDELLSTHDLVKIPCIKTDALFDIWSEDFGIDLEKDIQLVSRYKDKIKISVSEVILINEAQFFPDLERFVIKMLEYGKKVYLCGLDGDFKRQKFGQILDLIPLCDKITKLTSLCSICRNGTPGIFTKRITNEETQIVVGVDNYIPVCRMCYES